MHNNYDLVVLMPASGPDGIEQVKKIISQANGEVIKTDEWGVRTLSYPIRKKIQAAYYFFEVSLPSAEVSQVNKMLRVHDNVLRYLLLKKEGVRKEQETLSSKLQRGEKEPKAKKTEEKTVKKSKRVKGGEK